MNLSHPIRPSPHSQDKLGGRFLYRSDASEGAADGEIVVEEGEREAGNEGMNPHPYPRKFH